MYIVDLRLIDLSEGRFLQLEHAEKIEITRYNFNSMGFLPNGDLVLVSSSITNYLKDYKIYRYSVENKPTTNTTFWKCSQIYDIELTEHINDYYYSYFFVYQTKLFFINTHKKLMFQWNLSTMTFDMQYFLDDFDYFSKFEIVINKNQTLLALNYRFYVFSMETGTLIFKYG